MNYSKTRLTKCFHWNFISWISYFNQYNLSNRVNILSRCNLMILYILRLSKINFPSIIKLEWKLEIMLKILKFRKVVVTNELRLLEYTCTLPSLLCCYILAWLNFMYSRVADLANVILFACEESQQKNVRPTETEEKGTEKKEESNLR